MNEAETRAELIDHYLKACGWCIPAYNWSNSQLMQVMQLPDAQLNPAIGD